MKAKGKSIFGKFCSKQDKSNKVRQQEYSKSKSVHFIFLFSYSNYINIWNWTISNFINCNDAIFSLIGTIVSLSAVDFAPLLSIFPCSPYSISKTPQKLSKTQRAVTFPLLQYFPSAL